MIFARELTPKELGDWRSDDQRLRWDPAKQQAANPAARNSIPKMANARAALNISGVAPAKDVLLVSKQLSVKLLMANEKKNSEQNSGPVNAGLAKLFVSG
jgi:hypothetical protein